MESCETALEESLRIRLFLAADQALFRASLSRLLALEPDFEMVGECGISNGAIGLLTGAGADVALLEFDPHAGDPAGFMASAVHAGYKGKIFIITTMLDGRNAARALRLGASG